MSTTRIRYAALVVSSLLALTGVSGCSNANQGEGGGQAVTPELTSPRSPTTGSTPEAGATGGEPVEVRLSEYEVEMPSSLPAGRTTLEVANVGNAVHNFEIEGNGLEKKFETNLQPGQSETMRVELKPGTYEVYCPVEGHRGLGMELEVTAK
jgi:plastocyanin